MHGKFGINAGCLEEWTPLPQPQYPPESLHPPTRHTLPTWNRRSRVKFKKKALSSAFEANSKRKKGRDSEGKDGECKTKQQRRRDACWGHVGWITNVSNPKNQALQISLTQKDFENHRAGKMDSWWCQAHTQRWLAAQCLPDRQHRKQGTEDFFIRFHGRDQGFLLKLYTSRKHGSGLPAHFNKWTHFLVLLAKTRGDRFLLLCKFFLNWFVCNAVI